MTIKNTLRTLGRFFRPTDKAAVLRLLAAMPPMSGRELRARLAKEGHRMSGPAFYKLMHDFEDQGRVEITTKPKTVEGNRIQETHIRPIV